MFPKRQFIITGQQIKRIRKEMGYTQAQFAAALHMSRGTLSHIETNKKEITEDFLNELYLVMDGRSGPMYPGHVDGSCYSPGPSRYEFKVAEDDYPCRHCVNNSARPGFDLGESPCRQCRYNRRKSYC